LNPVALQRALEMCPAQSPKTVSCSELRAIALNVNELAFDLRTDPQGFGLKILSLQQTIAKQQRDLKSDSAQSEALSTSLKQNQQELERRLAIVKWLESPA